MPMTPGVAFPSGLSSSIIVAIAALHLAQALALLSSNARRAASSVP